jgi:rhamnopyranosyl-N-acetylglucosaminyl-diphospho-decaprenol beta-1,3/1,4-galactofuranosyltransferase
MLEEPSKVCVVLVTYNRVKYLRECVDAVLKQERPIDHLLVINNASTDDTSTYLSELADIQPDKVSVITLPTNTGGAGGFNHGLACAFDLGYDWIWVMDDDVAPVNSALGVLLSYKDISKCIHPGRCYEDGSEVDWAPIFDPVSLNDFQMPKAQHFSHELRFVFGACFEGMLVHRSILEKVPLPDPEFFLAKDDLIFGFEAAQYTNVCVTVAPLMIRKIKPSPVVSKLNMYHGLKNTILIARSLDAYFPQTVRKRKLYLTFSIMNYFRIFFKYYGIEGIVEFFKSVSHARNILRRRALENPKL